MVWGCFSAACAPNLATIEGTLDSAPPGGDSRKRKRVLEDFAEESKVRTKNISELVSTVKVLVANSSSGGASESSSGGHEKLPSEIFTLTKQLNEFRKMYERNPLTQQSIQLTGTALRCAQSNCARILDKND